MRVPHHALSCAAAVLAAYVSGCSRGETQATSPRDDPHDAPGSAVDWFTDRAAATGLDFVHFNGMSGEFYYPEMFAPGVGLVDVDDDGDLDVYVVQGQMLGGKDPAVAVYPPRDELRDRLFRNDLVVNTDGTRTLHFTDVTSAAGLALRSYGMGVAAGDVDNDGRVDLYRTGLDGGTLLRNNGDGTFADVTARTGTGNAGSWGVSAAFLDYDRDGWLDLFVANYVEYSVATDVDCTTVAGRVDYCPPARFAARRDRLYRNRADGTFTDVTARALVGGADGPALGVATADFDGDGWIDIYVADDGEPNQLWINQRDGTFRDRALVAGAAVSGAGAAEASMGVDAGDFDADGDEDLFITNWLSQMHTLYVNTGGVFEDRRAAAGLGAPTLSRTGFGTGWFDADNDGWLDLFTANGSVSTIDAQARAGDPFPFRMPNQLFRNLGNGRFADVSASGGTALAAPGVARGAAFGDVDNDGRVDILVGYDSGPLQLLMNRGAPSAVASGGDSPRHWIGLRIVTAEGRDALGARVAVTTGSGRTLWRRARADGSYASANDPRVHVGLGADTGAVRVQVSWPDGKAEEWREVPTDRWTTIRQGTGR